MAGRRDPGSERDGRRRRGEKPVLDLADDQRFQRWEWRTQRWGQAVLFLGVVAAIAGLFGGGVFSSARQVSADGTLGVTYERFARRGAHTRVRLDLAAPREGRHTLRLSRDYVSAVEVRQMTPSPSEVALTPEGTELVFELDRAGAVELDIWPTRAGRLRAEFALDDRAHVTLWQWVWF